MSFGPVRPSHSQDGQGLPTDGGPHDGKPSAGPREAPNSPSAHPTCWGSLSLPKFSLWVLDGEPSCQNLVSAPYFGVTDLRMAFTQTFPEAHLALLHPGSWARLEVVMEKGGGREQGGGGVGPGEPDLFPRLVIARGPVRIKVPCAHRGWHSEAV